MWMMLFVTPTTPQRLPILIKFGLDTLLFISVPREQYRGYKLFSNTDHDDNDLFSENLFKLLKNK